MRWTVNFDIVALLINSILLFVFTSYKNFETKQNKIFKNLIHICLLSSITDILAAVAGSYFGSKYLISNYIFHLLHMIIQNFVPVIYCLFVYSMVYETGKMDFKRKAAIYFPYVVCALCIITTPFSNLMFFFNNGEYSRNWGQSILYFAAVYYLLLCCFIVVRHLSELTKMQRISVVFYTSANIIMFIIQIFFPRYLLQELGISLSLFFIYLTMQNPLEFMDTQTDTFNRNLFIKIVGNLLGGSDKFSILCVQLDGFKYINEKFGMSNGNLLLRQIAEFLTSLEKNMKVFHLAGTQFAVIIKDVRKTNQLISKIYDRFEKPFFLNNIEVNIWACLCCVSYPDNVSTLSDVIDTIDYSINEAKGSNQNCIIYESSEILAKKRRECAVKKAVENAVINKSFEVYYQPIYSVNNKKYTSAEALVRLQDKELGFIPPDEFIPMTEKNGSIIAIGEIVLEKVCIFIQEQHPEDFGITCIHVNLSVVQCMQENIVNKLFSIIDRYNIPHSLINFEITETTAINTGDNLADKMLTMNRRGIHFALDDYGTGFSNTANIMQYPYSVVKLDKSLLWAAEVKIKAAISLKYIIAMIKELEMYSLVEGVETIKQVHMLVDLGCEYFQGFFYSRPVNKNEFLDIIKNKIIRGDE